MPTLRDQGQGSPASVGSAAWTRGQHRFSIKSQTEIFGFVAQKQPQTQGSIWTWPDLLTRPGPPEWAASGGSKGRGALEKREGLPCLDIVAPNPQDCGPQAGELSPLKVPRGSKEKAKGAGSRVHGDLPGALGCPGTADRAASTPRGRESSSHNDGLKRPITHWTARNTGNRSTASMQHHRVVR